MAQRLRSRAKAAVAAGLAATCIGVAAAPAFADTVRNEEWWLTSLHVTKAWLSSRGAGVTVAVLDTGVDATQPDLAGSVTTGKDYTNSGRTAGGPFWGGHGTAVASLIAGHGHGPHHADGIMGVAPLAKILSVRVTLENKDPLLANPTVVAALPDAIARGINYAVRHGASHRPAARPGRSGRRDHDRRQPGRAGRGRDRTAQGRRPGRPLRRQRRRDRHGQLPGGLPGRDLSRRVRAGLRQGAVHQPSALRDADRGR